jgi:hypothetical protein
MPTQPLGARASRSNSCLSASGHADVSALVVALSFMVSAIGSSWVRAFR